MACNDDDDNDNNNNNNTPASVIMCLEEHDALLEMFETVLFTHVLRKLVNHVMTYFCYCELRPMTSICGCSKCTCNTDAVDVNDGDMTKMTVVMRII